MGYIDGRSGSGFIRENQQQPARSPLLKVIRAKCLDCCCGSAAEVRRCHLKHCPLWPYRMGENPFARPRGRSFPGSERSLKNSSQFAANSGGKQPSDPVRP
jgi:hypothetical protein